MKKLKSLINEIKTKPNPKVKELEEFQKLDFDTHPNGMGLQAIYFYPNNFGVSVITGESSMYINAGQPYEIGILKTMKKEWTITYDTPITSDVLGYQTETNVNDVMIPVKNLKKEK